MRRIVWSEEAHADLLKLLARIQPDNPGAARRVADAIDTAVRSLAERNIGRRGRVEGTFEKTVVGLPYVVAYAIEVGASGSERVAILRVIHTSRQWLPGTWPDP